jgi:integrase
MKAAGDNRHGHRDATMILLAYRHGLRASELCSLRWEQVDLAHARLHVSRAKSGIPCVHPLTGTELRALRRLQREQEPGRYVFMSERGAPMSAVGFRRMITRLGKAAKMPFGVHPHMLRHACGYKLANQGVILAACNTTSATRTSSTRCDIPSYRPSGFAIFGRTERGW